MSPRSNWHQSEPRRAVGEPDSSRPDLRDVNRSTGALEHQSTSAPIDESKADPRPKRPMLRGEVPQQKLEKYKLFCLLYGKEIKEAMEEAWDDLLLKYSMPTGALEHQSTNLNDLDDPDDDAKERTTTASSSLFPEAGAPEHQTPEDHKAKQMLAFYTERTGNVAKPRDHDAYFQGSKENPGVAELPEPVIMWGIMQSVLLCRSRVNSFSYCLGAIHDAADVGVSAEIVNHVLRTFNERLEGMKAFRAGDEEKQAKAMGEMRRKGQPTLPEAGGELKEFKK